MKTLVTGGAGFLGSHIVRQLVNSNENIRVLALPSESTAAIDDLPVEIFKGDITDIESVHKAVSGCDKIFHTAGYVSYWRGDRELQHRVNVDGVRNICQAALEKNVKKLVHTSSVVTLGFSRKKGQIHNEDSVFNQEHCGIGYVTTKRAGELEVFKAIEKGLNAVIVNPTTMFGAWDTNLNAGEFIVKIARGQIPAVPVGGMNFIDVNDAAYGHLAAMERGKIGERYILGCVNLTYNELFKIIGSILNVKVPTIPIPYFLALILGYWGNIISFFTRKYPNITPESVRMTGNFLYYDSSKAVNELGLPQTPLENAIRSAVNYYRENGII